MNIRLMGNLGLYKKEKQNNLLKQQNAMTFKGEHSFKMQSINQDTVSLKNKKSTSKGKFLRGSDHMEEIKGERNVDLFDSASADRASARYINMSENTRVEKIEKCHNAVLSGSAQTIEINAKHANLYGKSGAGTIKAEKTASLRDNAKVADIIMTGKGNPVVRIHGNCTEIKGKIKFKNAQGEVILLPDENAEIANISKIKSKIENGSIKLQGDLINLRDDMPEEEIYGENTNFVLTGNAKVKAVSGKKVALVHQASAEIVKAKKSIDLRDSAKVKDIIITGKDNPQVRIYGRKVQIKGKIKFPKGVNGKVVLYADPSGYPSINDKQIENGKWKYMLYV